MLEPKDKPKPRIEYIQPSNISQEVVIITEVIELPTERNFSSNNYLEQDTSIFTPRDKLPTTKTYQTFIIRDPKITKVFNCAIPREESDLLSVEWLFNEYAKWRTRKIGDDISLIICLKTADAHINFDCLLTKPSVPLSVFPLVMDLEPYYSEHIERVDFKAFKILRIVGEGAFSKVAVVRRKDTGMIFAMKILKKGNFEKEHKDVYIFSEKSILTLIDHPHLVLSFN